MTEPTLREAALAVLSELDIIRRDWQEDGNYLVVHIDTHRDLAAALATTPPALDVTAAVNTLRRAGVGERQARSLAALTLAAALTGERHDLDDEYLTPEQRALVAALSTGDKP